MHSFLSIDLGLKHLGYANIRYNKEGVKSFGLLLNGVNVQLFDPKMKFTHNQTT